MWLFQLSGPDLTVRPKGLVTLLRSSLYELGR